MAKYRNALPQLSDDVFLVDGGAETTFIFHQGIDLPYFAAFCLLQKEQGRKLVQDYFHSYTDIAKEHNAGFILESLTWRANPDWAEKMGYSADDLAQCNREWIALLEDIRSHCETQECRMVLSGCIGPRGDGYDPAAGMTAEEAQDYHSQQIGTFADTAADMVAALTMTHPEEAIGISRAARSFGIPAAISFTVETDGKLPNGLSLGEAIKQVDAATRETPAYYMVNCAHPTHFAHVLKTDEPWTQRIRGIRANASRKSHKELDEAETLDDGNPQELGQQYRELRKRMHHLTVLGGCCGTDQRHMRAISEACLH